MPRERPPNPWNWAAAWNGPVSPARGNPRRRPTPSLAVSAEVLAVAEQNFDLLLLIRSSGEASFNNLPESVSEPVWELAGCVVGSARCLLTPQGSLEPGRDASPGRLGTVKHGRFGESSLPASDEIASLTPR